MGILWSVHEKRCVNDGHTIMPAMNIYDMKTQIAFNDASHAQIISYIILSLIMKKIQS